MRRISESTLTYLHHKVVRREKLNYKDKKLLNQLFRQALNGERLNTGKEENANDMH